jgi:hypothetical protein
VTRCALRRAASRKSWLLTAQKSYKRGETTRLYLARKTRLARINMAAKSLL